MKARITFDKVYFDRKSKEPGKNEFFFAYNALVLASSGDDPGEDQGKVVQVRVSEVATGIKDDSVWKPDADNAVEVDINGVAKVKLTIAFYERDNGKVYAKLKKGFENPIVDAEEFKPLKELIEIIPDFEDITSPQKWAQGLFSYLGEFISFLRGDDFQDVQTVTIDVGDQDAPWDGPRQISFRGAKRAKFNLSLGIRKVG